MVYFLLRVVQDKNFKMPPGSYATRGALQAGVGTVGSRLLWLARCREENAPQYGQSNVTVGNSVGRLMQRISAASDC